MIVPPEVVKKYGNMDDWKTSVGTGPFILADFVSNSVTTLNRNRQLVHERPGGSRQGQPVAVR